MVFNPFRRYEVQRKASISEIKKEAKLAPTPETVEKVVPIIDVHSGSEVQRGRVHTGITAVHSIAKNDPELLIPVMGLLARLIRDLHPHIPTWKLAESVRLLAEENPVAARGAKSALLETIETQLNPNVARKLLFAETGHSNPANMRFIEPAFEALALMDSSEATEQLKKYTDSEWVEIRTAAERALQIQRGRR
jgi:hypothetical protein